MRPWLIAAAAFVAAVYLLNNILLPFVAGMAVAYFLDPVADRLQRGGLSRLMATIFITGGFFVLLTVLLVLLAPVLQTQVLAFINNLPSYLETAAQALAPLIETAERLFTDEALRDLQAQASDVAGAAAGWAADVLGRVVGGGVALFNLLSLVFITPVVAFYLLRDWDHMVARIDACLPRRHADVIRAQLREIDRTLSGFVRGQATVCLVLGTLYAVALTIAGLNLGLFVGLLSGLISFIPYLGSITGFVLGVVLAYAQTGDWVLPAVVAGVFAAGQIIEGNFLTPRLVGGRVGLHPVWVIFALLAGASLFGFVGLLLAVPVAAVIGVLVRFALGRYLDSELYGGAGDPDDAAPARSESDGV